MMVVANHETGHLIWAKKGHGKEVLREFLRLCRKRSGQAFNLPRQTAHVGLLAHRGISP